MRTSIAIALLAFVFVVAGCKIGGNLLKNSGFEKWNGLPEGWAAEGEPTVKKSPDGAELTSKGQGTPFLYQQFPLKKGLSGKRVTFGAWVKSDVPESAFLEYSDRKGTDVKSAPHPGDGEWHYLSLSARLDEAPGVAEFRFRNYRQGANYYKEPTVSFGFLSGASGPGFTASTAIKVAFLAVIGVLLAVAVLGFRKGEAVHSRFLKAFFAFVLLSSIALILQRPDGAVVASSVALVCLAVFLAAFSIRVLRDKNEALPGFLKRIDVAVISFSVLFAGLAVNALRTGSVQEAERNAKRAYILFVAGGAIITVAKLVPRKSKGVEEIEILRAQALRAARIGAGPEGSDFNVQVLNPEAVRIESETGMEENR